MGMQARELKHCNALPGCALDRVALAEIAATACLLQVLLLADKTRRCTVRRWLESMSPAAQDNL